MKLRQLRELSLLLGSKFVLSRNFYVHKHVNFTRVNKIEAMNGTRRRKS